MEVENGVSDVSQNTDRQMGGVEIKDRDFRNIDEGVAGSDRWHSQEIMENNVECQETDCELAELVSYSSIDI